MHFGLMAVAIAIRHPRERSIANSNIKRLGLHEQGGEIVTDTYLKSDIGQVKLATAALIASIVQTLNESDPTFRARFEEHWSSGISRCETAGGAALMH